MNAPPTAEIEISYNPTTLRGAFRFQNTQASAIWERLTQRATALEPDYELAPGVLEVPWATVLSIIREFAPLQRAQGFHFRPIGPAKEKVEQFVREYKAVKNSRGTLTTTLTEDQIEQRLQALA